MPLLPWKGRAMLLVDLDAFFASVEQLDHPEWRGKPVIVGGDPDRRGVVSTCSYEARAYGVHSAQASSVARRLCPDAIWSGGNFPRYNEMSAQVMDILHDESPLLQQVSIDEAFLDVTPGRYTGEHPVTIAQRIQSRVADLGITCSIGLGTSKSVAKIASDMDKPSGITIVYPGREESFLSPLPIGALSGIGKSSARKLAARGIKTLGDIARADPSTLEDVFGINTQRTIDRCRGADTDEIVVERDMKSVSNEMTFSVDICEQAELEQAIRMMGAKVGRRLRTKGVAGSTVTLKLRYDDRSIRTAQHPLENPTDDENVFLPVALSMLPRLFEPGMKVRLVGVGISGFGERSEQLGLLTDEAVTDAHRRRNLVVATDKVKDRFGDAAVAYGRDLKFKDRSTGTPER